MPAIIALIIRQVIIAVGTGAVITGGEALLDGTAKELVKEVRDTEDVTETEAKDIVGNMFIDLGINSALVFATLRAKVGLKLADYLGFSTRGFTKKVLTGKAAKASAKLTAKTGKTEAKGYLSKLLKSTGFLTAPIWLSIGIANVVEPFIYKPKEANDVWEQLVGFRPLDDPKVKLYPGPFSADSSVTFNDFATSLEKSGVRGLLSPVRQQSILYSRDELADIVNFVYGKEVANGKVLDVKGIIGLMGKYIISDNKTPTTQTTPVKQPTSTPQVKVFTGIVSQGVLGQNLTFTPRENDLIETLDELRDSAHNNLAPFLVSISRLITYEIKVVSSVLTANGFRQYGTAQQVPNGNYANGNIKYKTVVNKFAVMDLYIKNVSGGRTKLQTVVLGPVDSVRLQVQPNELAQMATQLQKDISSTSVSDVTNVTEMQNLSSVSNLAGVNGSTSTPATPAPQPIKVTPRDYFITNLDFADVVGYEINGKIVVSPDFSTLLTDSEKRTAGNYGEQIKIGIDRLKSLGVDIYSFRRKRFFWEIDGKSAEQIKTATFAEFFGLGAVDIQTIKNVTTETPKNQAKTLFEYYTQKGQTLPTVQERSKIYESLGLGVASYYVGTAEQNTKLLTKLLEN